MTDIKEAEYAILSHTWDRRGEQTYQDLKRIQDRGTLAKLGALPWQSAIMIRDACTVARTNGFDLIWIDSCCIDKTSSAELSEAINSMYAWYAKAEVCYAYLVDVPFNDDHWASRSSFRWGVWFTRGWTLQELIAPFEVIILSQDWKAIGSKRDLVDLIEEITKISAEALLHEIPLNKYSVAQRLSWASRRRTTRVEDQAYSLLGMFDIHMPTLYGEGEGAFRRLQEAIMQRIPDQTLFASWMVCDLFERDNTPPSDPPQRQGQPPFVCSRHLQQDLSILARSPSDFAHVSSVVAIPHDEICCRLRRQLPAPEYTFTPHGIRTQLPVIPFAHCLPPNGVSCPDNYPLSEWYLVILGCESTRHPGRLLGRLCHIPPSEFGVEFLYSGLLTVPQRGGLYHPNLFPFPMIELYSSFIELKTVHIAHPGAHQFQTLSDAAEHRPHKAIHLTLSRSARNALLARGYTAELSGPTDRDGVVKSTTATSTHHCLTLSHMHDVKHTITIEYEHTLKDKGAHLTIGGHVTVSQPDDPDPGSSAIRNYANPSTVVWTDISPWHLSLQSYTVDITVSRREICRLQLSATFVRRSYYSLGVEVFDVVDEV